MNNKILNLIKVLLIIVLFVILIGIFLKSKDISVKRDYYGATLSDLGDITCTYPQVLHTKYQNNKIEHRLSEPETNPIVMTFSNLNRDVSKIKFIDATRTISEVSAVTLANTDDKIILIEGDGTPYMAMHTLYKKSGVAIYAKEASLIETPFGSMSMGSCINS